MPDVAGVRICIGDKATLTIVRDTHAYRSHGIIAHNHKVAADTRTLDFIQDQTAENIASHLAQQRYAHSQARERGCSIEYRADAHRKIRGIDLTARPWPMG